jgi:hypothetical protein
MQGLPLTGAFGGGFLGYAIELRRNVEEERRLVRWLNDEWEDASTQFEKWKRGEGEFRVPSKEDAGARKEIVTRFIPALMNVQQRMPRSTQKGIEKARRAMERFPGRYRDAETAFREVNGVNDRARIIQMLSKHTIIPWVGPPSRDQARILLVRGPNMTEVWAAHVLLQMASDGVLKNLLRCKCGCGKWFVRTRKIDKFASTACRVRFHQSDPDFKEKRRRQARERYHFERKRSL